MSQHEEGAYLKLQVRVPNDNVTRANPTGGANGDGTEAGIESGNRHENKLNNVMVFIIRAYNGLDASGTTTFLFKGYLNSLSEGWSEQTYGVDVTFPTGDYVPQDGDRVIVVANAGNKTNLITTLGALRDWTTYSAWSGSSVSEAHDFVMSSADNSGTQGKVVVGTHTGRKEDPYISELDIQRAAARIDFMYNDTHNRPSSSSNKELLYDVTRDPEVRTSDVLGTVHLQNIIPVNLMQESSGFIKRVTENDNIKSAIKYAAAETPTVGKPTNYVIEPHTLDKENKRVEELDTELGTWYGSTRASQVFASPNSCLGDANSIATYMATKTEKSEMSYFTHYMTLAYTNENTQSKEKHDPNFMTGLLLKATYVPTTVYSDASLTVASYTKGTTFWRYTPTKASMVEEDSKYFTTEGAATAYKAAHPEDLAEIVEYPSGICYYNLWLRHANVEANPHETFPMEYGIVRNNIYRVGVEKFTGPGTPTPSYEGPEHVRLRIFVRPWNRRVHPEILL